MAVHDVSGAGLPAGSTTNAATYSLGPYTPTANDLIVVVVGITGSTSTDWVLTDNHGGTYTKIGRVTKNSGADFAELWVADQLASAVSTTFTYSHASGNATGFVGHVYGVSGMSRTGSNAVRQFGGQSNQASGTATDVMSGVAALTTNALIAFQHLDSNSGGSNTPSGWAAITTQSYTSPATGLRSTYIASGFTGTTVTWSSSSAVGFSSFAAEIDSSAATVTQELAGQIDGAATLTGDLELDKELAGTITGTATLTGALDQLFRELAGTIAGQATLTGDLTDTPAGVIQELAGTVTGAGTTTGDLQLIKELAGTVAGAATVTANLELIKELAASVAGAGTLTGNLELIRELAGLIAGTATLTGNLTDTPPGVQDLAGTITGQGTLTGALTVLTTHELAGLIAGAGTLTGDLTDTPAAIQELAGTIAGLATLIGDLEIVAAVRSVTIPPERFPAGTLVSVYLASAWPGRVVGNGEPRLEEPIMTAIATDYGTTFINPPDEDLYAVADVPEQHSVSLAIQRTTPALHVVAFHG